MLTKKPKPGLATCSTWPHAAGSINVSNKEKKELRQLTEQPEAKSETSHR